MDLLYTLILGEALGDDKPEYDAKTLSVLSAVVLATNPLSPSTITTLSKLDAEDVSSVLSSVHSLLIFPEDGVNHPVRSFHKSFPDFIPSESSGERSEPERSLATRVRSMWQRSRPSDSDQARSSRVASP